MQEQRVDSWNGLLEILYAESWREDLGRYRSRFAFRGLGDADYRLRTTLIRLGGDSAFLERHLLRNFRKYAHRDVVDTDSVWNWLAVAQHHRLPTRLLDWTYSPLVALHHATSELDIYQRDGVVWCLDFASLRRELPAPLRGILEDEGAGVFTVEMLAQAASTLDEFGALGESPFVVFIEPPSLDDRIVNQYALFSVLSDPHLGLDEWLRDHPDVCRKVIIPAELKWEIRDKLDQSNITERVLFPGLDGLSEWLKRHYSRRERP